MDRAHQPARAGGPLVRGTTASSGCGDPLIEIDSESE
jgi:hypothetical protein